MQIRSDVLRIYQKVHLWTGITAGILLFICFFAGALTMFKPQLSAWASPPTDILPQIPVTQVDTLLQKALAQHPEIGKGFTLHLDDDKYAPLTWYQSGGGRELNLDAQQWQATLDEQGKLLTQKVQPSQLGTLIDQLHRTAGIPGDVGHEQLGVLVMGIASILYFMALVSGVIFLLPTLVKNLFALRQKKGASRFWLDTHNLLGITALPFHIVIAITVVVFAFHDVFYDALGEFVYGERPVFNRVAPLKQPLDISHLPLLSDIIATANRHAPGYQAQSLTFMGLDSPRPAVRIEMYNEAALMRGPIADFLSLQPYSLQPQFSTFTPGETGLWGRVVSVCFGLHFGSFGGMPGRWLYFFMGLSGAMLFYSGNLLWLEKRRQQQKGTTLPQQPRTVRLMAATTVGCCLGSVASVAMTLLAAKWLHAWVDNSNYAYLWSYYLCFFAAVIYSFWRGAARAAIHLLRLTALACVAMPLTAIAATCFPTLGIWAPQTLSNLMVELVALLFAFGCSYSARLTCQRAYHGPADSIWAIAPKANAHSTTSNASAC
ncbi:PepSY-associated TM helix domain-containing protein [Shewanella sp. A32]|uniref:PepSY-associated TM helix domain-containing protein n=1 Tax=Shewanella sp. A32 TaxID=3031327 RepID=UPI0023B9B206|nr:PepSY-associated TM helix domain-containing protein [Shewanella sp. A32]MDF0533404.1 PepSY-associated TM helix domain-containing protein [Shewanella sp. A32]